MTAFTPSDICEMLNSRDTGYFSIVHGNYFRRMLVECLKRGVQSDEAEEMVNDIFIYLYTNGRDKIFQSPKHVSNYLFRAIYNKCNEWSRTRKFHMNIDDDWHLESPILNMIELNLRERIWNALNDRFREIFDKSTCRSLDIVRMIYLEQKSVPEVACQMGIAEQTVRNLKGMGLKIMRKSLSREDFLIEPILFLLTFYITTC